MEGLEEAVRDAVSSALGDFKKESPPSPKTRKTSGKSAANAANADIAEIVAKAIAALQPMLISVIATAVKVSSEAIFEELKKGACPPSTVSSVQTNRFEIDRLEQYSRRDNLKLVGVPERPNEDCVQLVKEVASDLNINLQDQEISTAHRLKSRSKRGNPIIVRFVRRETKINILSKKKQLKDKRKETFIEEDLTPLRSKLFWTVKKDETVEAAWVRDGKTHCLLKSPQRLKDGSESRRFVLDTPEDIFQLGWSEDKIRQTGLYQA